jgi:hypothetical protein
MAPCHSLIYLSTQSVIIMLATFLLRLQKINRLNYYTGWVLLLLAALLLPATIIDPRMVEGVSTWVKPAKFAISIAIFLWTISWYINHLPVSKRHKNRLLLLIWVCMVAEYSLLLIQAARGVPSHYNVATTFDGFVFLFMGVFIGLATVAVAYILLLFFLLESRQPLPYLWGIRWGLILFLLASTVGGYMISINGHSIGPQEGSLFFLDWNSTGGDLRVAHFVGLHALQLLPLLSWYLYRYSLQWRIHFPVIWVFSLALIYLLYSLYVTFEALSGIPHIN